MRVSLEQETDDQKTVIQSEARRMHGAVAVQNRWPSLARHQVRPGFSEDERPQGQQELTKPMSGLGGQRTVLQVRSSKCKGLWGEGEHGAFKGTQTF